MSNMRKWKGNPQRLRTLGTRDAVWTDLSRRTEQIEQIKKEGFNTESDVQLMQDCLTIVLAEIMWREAEMTVEESDE